MIAAIETKDEIFDGLRGTRLSDPESWKKFIQSAAPHERQYLGQVLLILKEMAKDAKPQQRLAFIYNFRTKNAIPYDLGAPP
jgi:translation initiation factor 2-alpha kinase 4